MRPAHPKALSRFWGFEHLHRYGTTIGMQYVLSVSCRSFIFIFFHHVDGHKFVVEDEGFGVHYALEVVVDAEDRAEHGTDGAFEDLVVACVGGCSVNALVGEPAVVAAAEAAHKVEDEEALQESDGEEVGDAALIFEDVDEPLHMHGAKALELEGEAVEFGETSVEGILHVAFVGFVLHADAPALGTVWAAFDDAYVADGLGVVPRKVG